MSKIPLSIPPRKLERGPTPASACAPAAGSLERQLAEDLAGVFVVSAPEVDLIEFGFAIVDEGRRREEQGAVVT